MKIRSETVKSSVIHNWPHSFKSYSKATFNTLYSKNDTPGVIHMIIYVVCLVYGWKTLHFFFNDTGVRFKLRYMRLMSFILAFFQENAQYSHLCCFCLSFGLSILGSLFNVIRPNRRFVNFDFVWYT